MDAHDQLDEQKSGQLDEQKSGQPDEQKSGQTDEQKSVPVAPPQERWVSRTASAFLTVEHGAYMALGALLSVTALVALGGAAYVLVRGLGDWDSTQPIFLVIDRLLFVLMLIEILHTVRASMRSGELTSEPFLVVGLIATIRRVLVITLKSSETTKGDTMSDMAERMFHASMLELGVLAVLILVMVVSIRILRHGRRVETAGAGK